MSQANQTSRPAKQVNKSRKVRGASRDLVHGQIVIVTARWILVLTGLLLTMWNPGPIGELRIQIMVILLLAIANFYLQAQLLMRRPALDQVVYAASAADLTVITILIMNGGGFDSGLYIFYFPAILAFSIAFPTIYTWLYAASTMAIYALISLFTLDVGVSDLQIILARLLMIAAVAFCGNLYWRIEKGRREEAVAAQTELMTQMRTRQTAPLAQASTTSGSS
jgi:hypothetical protein